MKVTVRSCLFHLLVLACAAPASLAAEEEAKPQREEAKTEAEAKPSATEHKQETAQPDPKAKTGPPGAKPDPDAPVNVLVTAPRRDPTPQIEPVSATVLTQDRIEKSGLAHTLDL